MTLATPVSIINKTSIKSPGNRPADIACMNEYPPIAFMAPVPVTFSSSLASVIPHQSYPVARPSPVITAENVQQMINNTLSADGVISSAHVRGAGSTIIQRECINRRVLEIYDSLESSLIKRARKRGQPLVKMMSPSQFDMFLGMSGKSWLTFC
jgi:hypothetical protein